MKKVFTIITAIAAAAFLAGCSQPTSDSSSSSSGSNTSSSSSDTTSTVSSTPASVTYPAMTAGTILKNTATSSGDTYAEYLAFTSTTNGNYTRYKNGTVETKAINFTYVPSTGLLTLSTGAYGYIFMVVGTTYYWTHYQFTRTSGSGLFGMWTAKVGSVTPGVSFATDGSCIFYTDGVQNDTGTFTDNNGYITFTYSNGKVDPYTTIYSSDDHLYYACYTMTPVSAVGNQAAPSSEPVFSSVSDELFDSHDMIPLFK